MISFSTCISQQNAQSAGSEDKAQSAYTDIDRDRGEKGQEDVLRGTSLGGKTRLRLGAQLLTGGVYILFTYVTSHCDINLFREQ